MNVVTGILGAIIALPKIGAMVNDWLAAITAWYVTTVNEKNAQAISDAASFAARAKTKEDRIEAASKWQTALSRRSST